MVSLFIGKFKNSLSKSCMLILIVMALSYSIYLQSDQGSVLLRLKNFVKSSNGFRVNIMNLTLTVNSSTSFWQDANNNESNNIDPTLITINSSLGDYLLDTNLTLKIPSLSLFWPDVTGDFNQTKNNNQITDAFNKALGPTVGIVDFRNKLLTYLKEKAKLTSPTTIELLKGTIQNINSVESLQLQQIPEEIIPLFKIVYLNKFWKGKQLPLIMTHIDGRIGNIMGQYATMFALNRLYNVSVLLHPDMMNVLSKDFPNLSLNETVSDEDSGNSSLWHTIANEGGTFMYGTFELAAAGLLGPKLFGFRGYGFEIQLWKFFYEDLKKDFTFSSELQKQADDYLHFVSDQTVIYSHPIVYIGFHVRRTDYENHMKVLFNATLPGDTYFELALNYYRKKIDHPVFIAASDDISFLNRSIIGKQKDVFISEGRSPLEDMAILASCNHSIMTLGTFGFWGSYLAGGEVLYPVDTKYKHPYRLNDRTLQELKLHNFTPIMF